MAKVGVVVANLGTPESASPNSVGKYLAEFLMDPYVIQLPWLFRFLLVRGIIAPFRKVKSAANYQKVWTKQGSPLLVETKKMATALQDQLGSDYQVEVAMRYGEPSFSKAEEKLKDCDRIVFFPQYPQFADSTVETSLEHLKKYFKTQEVKVVPPYYSHPRFIQAYRDFLVDQFSSLSFDHLLMSFHGLPESHIEKRDLSGSHCLKVSECCEKAQGEVLTNCYRAQCYASAREIARALNIRSERYTVSFQSRLGRQKWIEPYTEQMYKTLVDSGVKNLAVICPGFSVDGLETLEEIAIGGQEQFKELGGETFHFIPCLNDAKPWIDACVDIINEQVQLKEE